MGTESSDDIPPTPRNATSSQDTERDLAPLSSARGSGNLGVGTPSDISTTLGENTLLSMKGASARVSELPDHRVDELERRLSQLDARLKVIELQRNAGSAANGDKRWLVWVGLLLALILGWQLRAWFR